MTNLDHLTKAPKYFLYIDFEGVSRCDYKELNSTKEFLHTIKSTVHLLNHG